MMVTVDGLNIHVERRGSGPPLLLVHGLGSPLVWDRLIEPLSRSFDVIALDLPGFGSSDVPPAPFSTKQYANFIHLLLDAIQVQRTSILGISYGGEIAATFVCDHQKKVDKLVLISSTGLGPENPLLTSAPVWRLASFLVKNTVLRSSMMIRWFSCYSFFDRAQRPADLAVRFCRALADRGRKEAWLRCAYNALHADKDFPKRLAALTRPTLILWGREDRIVPVRWAQEFQKWIPNSALKILEGCGHSVPLEKAEEVCEEVKKIF